MKLKIIISVFLLAGGVVGYQLTNNTWKDSSDINAYISDPLYYSAAKKGQPLPAYKSSFHSGGTSGDIPINETFVPVLQGNNISSLPGKRMQSVNIRVEKSPYSLQQDGGSYNLSQSANASVGVPASGGASPSAAGAMLATAALSSRSSIGNNIATTTLQQLSGIQLLNGDWDDGDWGGDGPPGGGEDPDENGPVGTAHGFLALLVLLYGIFIFYRKNRK